MNKYVVLCMYLFNQSNKLIIITSLLVAMCFSLLILENARTKQL